MSLGMHAEFGAAIVSHHDVNASQPTIKVFASKLLHNAARCLQHAKRRFCTLCEYCYTAAAAKSRLFLYIASEQRALASQGSTRSTRRRNRCHAMVSVANSTQRGSIVSGADSIHIYREGRDSELT